MTELAHKAAAVRLKSLEMALAAKKGHVPPAFPWTEIGVALYYGGILRHDPRSPRWAQRDRFILSKGHACLPLYVMLADLGYFPADELNRFTGDGALLPGHPDPEIPGVECMSGSLGHGLGTGAGMALAARLRGEDWMTYVVLGDGECQEGSVWEAAMFAGHQRLSRLVAIVDRNGLGATARTEDSVALEPLADRWASFGWEVVEVPGHSLPDLVDVLGGARHRSGGKPLAVIARTVKGKGVPFMENSPDWHHRLPKGDEVEEALTTLRAALGSEEALP